MFTLSIITINYNNIEGLKKTVESVINQSFKEFEYIVIDGGSTDGSAEYILTQKHNFDYCVSETDRGIYNAMNKGIKASTGGFVIFMNSGDFLYNEIVLEKIIKNITPEDEILYGDVLLRNQYTNREQKEIYPKKLNFSYFYQQTICQQACIIKRSLFDTIFYYNETYKIASDWEFFIYAIFVERVKTKKIDLLISIYDTTGISGSFNFKLIAASEREQTLNKYFELYLDDYKLLMSFSSTRSKQLLQIEKSVFWRKFISVIFKLILLIRPEKK